MLQRVSYKTGTKQCERALFLDAQKPFWFKIFWGWRRTFVVNKMEIMDFIFSKNDINIIEKMK